MKSKITIDVDYDNQPVIKIEYLESEDVRDKLVKKFLETFGSVSVWSRSEYLHPYFGSQATTLNSLMIIRPISPENMEQQASEITNMVSYIPKFTEPKGEIGEVITK